MLTDGVNDTSIAMYEGTQSIRTHGRFVPIQTIRIQIRLIRTQTRMIRTHP